jgi:hypothetical protein
MAIAKDHESDDGSSVGDNASDSDESDSDSDSGNLKKRIKQATSKRVRMN